VPKQLLSLGYRILKKLTPRNRLGDRFISYLSFIFRHGRIPTNKLIFNDVLHQIKTTDEALNPLRVFVSDKEFVKLYIMAIVGDHYNVPTIAVLKTIQDVKNFSFPSQCAIKPTHASGMKIIRKNGEAIDIDEIRKWFLINYYEVGREAYYKKLKPKVIVEQLIPQEVGFREYRIYCYNGKPGLIGVDVDESSNKFFDASWNELNFSIELPQSDLTISKPRNFEEMLEVATDLSKRFTFIRVDLYSNGEALHVGELTNCHRGASGRFIPLTAEQGISDILFNNVP
jgi:hypothetical protein